MTAPFWIQSYTGRKVDLIHPRPSMIDIEDISHALSQLCRFTGHSPQFYSVAQHSVLVSLAVPEPYALEGLLHDAAEAYLGDVSSPLKRALCYMIDGTLDDLSGYDILEGRMAEVIYNKFGLRYPGSGVVKTADLRMLLTEKRMLGKEVQDWEVNETPYSMHIEPWPQGSVKGQFLHRFRQLYRGKGVE